MIQELHEAPLPRPENIKIKLPKRTPGFLRPQLKKELEGKAHTIVFLEEGIKVDGEYREYPHNVEGLKTFFREIHPGYCQCFKEEFMIPVASCLTETQRNDLKETGICEFSNGDSIQRMGQIIAFKEIHSSVHRNYTLTNVTHLNAQKEVPEDKIVQSVIDTSYKLESNGLYLSSMSTIGSIARANILEDAGDGFFPLWFINPKHLAAFYDSVKGPDFRCFVAGDSKNVIDSDLHFAYNYIAMYTPSSNPNYNYYNDSTDYHPEASFCSCLIWINIDRLEIMPLGIRVSKLLFTEDSYIPLAKTFIVHPYGKIKSVRVNMPILWYLLEVLGLRQGIDLGIIEGVWVIPKGAVNYPFKNWARKIINCAEKYDELKFLGQRGITGGIFTKAIKTGEYQYRYENWALPTENPVNLSHFFDMVKVLVLLGSARCKKVKGIAADGWVSEGGAPDSIGPVRIGSTDYGPFPVVNQHLEMYYQFDQIRHDRIVTLGQDDEWRNLSKKFADKEEITYTIKGASTFSDSGYRDPDLQSQEVTWEFHYKPNTGDNIPKGNLKKCGDTLGIEIPTEPPDVSQVGKRLPYITTMKFTKE